MAPALTQTADHPSLVEVSRCSPPPPVTTPACLVNAPFEGIKLKNFYNNSTFKDLNQIRTLISNGDPSSPAGLAPPASGRAEGCPVPTTPPTSPRGCTMEESPPLERKNSGGDLRDSDEKQSSKLDSNMGFHSLASMVGSPDTHLKVEKQELDPAPPADPIDGAISVNNTPSEILALMGKNVNEIIDTLQHLASNPELLEAANSELESTSSAPPMRTETPHSSQQCTAEASISRLALRQRQLERRRLFLQRRVQRITARGLGCAVSAQLSHLVQRGRKAIAVEKLKCPQPKETSPEEEPTLGIGALHKESMKNMSTSDLVTLVLKIEASQNLHRQNALAKPVSAKPSPALPPDLSKDVERVASKMRASAMQHVHHDSDATESSSGGESCDEYDGYHCSTSNYKPIRERAFYKYFRKRGWVASRWSWLQCQITSIDNKIQEQQKHIEHLRSGSCADDLTSKLKLPVRSPAHFDVQNPALTCIATPCASMRPTTLNGYHPPNKVEDTSVPSFPTFSAPNASYDVHDGCARATGVRKGKRRRYVRPSLVLKRRRLSSGGLAPTTGTFTESEDSDGRLCSCVAPVTCILCVKWGSNSSSTLGKRNSMASYSGSAYRNRMATIIPFKIPLGHRLSKMDPAFHPVLSDTLGMSQGGVFASIIRNPDWVQKAGNSKQAVQKEVPSSTTSATSSSTNSDELACEPQHRRPRRDREAKRNASRRWRDGSGKERLTLTNRRSHQKEDPDEEYGIWQISSGGSGHGSPCPSPALPDKDKNESKDKNSAYAGSGSNSNGVSSSSASSTSSTDTNSEKGPSLIETRASSRKHSTSLQKNKINSSSSSYDINNIVIPQSMAATTRVQPIQYKEIATPKWRITELYPLRRPKKFSYVEEDVSDEAFTVRHNRSEELERKKFLQVLQMYGTSGRARTRRTDSSGTNTPDNPLSPRETSENSPIASPPLTPQMIGGPSEDSNQSLTSTSAPSSNQATVLTLSLSALNSSMLKSNNFGESLADDSEQLEILNSSSSNEKSNSNIDILSSTNQPVHRMKRLLARDKVFQPISANPSVEEESASTEGERVSPFPCGTFPLKENEYEDLVSQASHRNFKNRSGGLGHSSKNSFVTSHKNQSRETASQCVIPISVAETVEEEVESGRDSPLSELTDSAPDEEDERCWDSSSTTPDWTISAVQDDTGCYVLQVQRN